MILNNDESIDPAWKHRLLQVIEGGSARCVGRYQTKEEGQSRARHYNLQYPAGLWLYSPPNGWGHLREEEGIK